MGMFTAISSTAFQELQTDAGMLLKNFDPTAPAAPQDEDIICATTGGITVTCVPKYSDYGEDVDNVPNNTMELKHLDSWECGISTTGLGVSPEAIQLSLGAADISGATYALTSDAAIVTGKTYYTRSGTSPNYVYTPVSSPVAGSLNTYYEMTSPNSKIVPRRDLKLADFADAIWWVGDRSDGGMVAVKLMYVLSSGGFSLKTTKNGKGQLTIELMGHVSLSAQDVVPMEFYSTAGETEESDGEG